MGAPQAVTAIDGSTVWRADWAPFGSVVIGQGKLTSHLRFPGQYFDEESGLHYNYYRHYDPETGRYIESDPIGLSGGLNTFAYVDGDPLLYVDPLGLASISYCYYYLDTGRLKCWGPDPSNPNKDKIVIDTMCYAGKGLGLNNPSYGYTTNTGPLPAGNYTIGRGINNNLGKPSLPLIPDPNTPMFNRDPSSFWMHADNPSKNNSASKGCIICDKNIRLKLKNGGIPLWVRGW